MRTKIATLLLIIGVFFMASSGASPNVVIAQAQRWASPVQLSGTTQSSWFPDIATGSDGSVHTVWASGIAHGEEASDQMDLVLYSELKDGHWSKSNDIVNPGTGGFASRTSIAIGRDGQLHMLVRSQLRIDYMHASIDHAGSAQAWSKPRKISNLSTTYYDSLSIDSKGKLHAIWNETALDDPAHPNKDCPSCSELFYRSSQDDGKQWSAPINLSQSPVGSAKPQVKIDSNDHIHVVWDEGKDTIVGKGAPIAGMYRQSRDGGITWDVATRFILPPIPSDEPGSQPKADAPQQMTIGLYQNRAPIVVYRSTLTNKIYFQFSQDDGKSWSKATQIPGILARELNDTPWDSYAMITDGGGNVHLIVSGFLSGDTDPTLNLHRTDQRTRPRLLHLVWNGKSWSSPEIAITDDRYPGWSAETTHICSAIDFNSPQSSTEEAKKALAACQELERYPEWPRVAISGSTLHLTWFTRNGLDRFSSDHATYQVWYSSLQLDAPAIASLPQFTPVPTAAGVQPTVTPASAPEPTLAPNVVAARQVDRPAAWEAPGMIVIGLAALPVVGLLGLVIVARALLLRRRQRVGH